MKNFLGRLLFVALIGTVATPFSGICQGEGDPDANVPIDGGLSLLAAAGVAYGVRKIYQKRKKVELDKNKL